MPAVQKIPPSLARQFARRAVLLDAPVAEVATALVHHGYVQIDPINICGRMHDLILRNRVSGYREGDLMRHLHGDDNSPHPTAKRTAFEHHLPSNGNILVAFSFEAWPHLRDANHARTRDDGAWSGKLDARQRRLAERIFAEIKERGPLSSKEIDDEQRDHHGWGASATLAKTTLQKLFFHGRLLISHRVKHRRYYDLPERVLPSVVIDTPSPTGAETKRWFAHLKLRQRRLVTLKREELRHIEDLVQPLAVEDCPPLYCLRTDLPLLEKIQTEEAKIEVSDPLLLAPLDPLIYDRRVTQCLWKFDYTWEVYTPAAKRVRGYYALPILAGTELVGHLDSKADRTARKLVVVSRSVRRGHRAAPAVRSFAKWLGLR